MKQPSISNTGATQCAIPRRHAACRNAAMFQARFSGFAKCFKFGRLAKIMFFLLCLTQFVHAQQQNWTGTKTLTAGQVVDDNIVLTGDVTINVASGEVTIKGIIRGNYNLTKGGAGTLSLNAENRYTGTTTVSKGILRLGDGAIDGNINYTHSVSVASGAFFEFAPKTYIYFTKVISGSGSVWKWGPGTIVLTGQHTYTGITHIGAGTLQIGDAMTQSNINTTSGVTIAADGILSFVPYSQTHFSKVISGAGKVSYYGGTGTDNMLILSANNTYTGGTRIGGGVLQIGAGGNTGSVTGNIENDGGLHFARNDDFAYSGNISGTGYVAKFGTGTLSLNGINTYTGATNIQGGTLDLYGAIENSSGVNFVDDGAFTLNVRVHRKINSLNSAYANSRVVLDASVLTNDGGGTFAGVISGTGHIIKTGNAKLTLTGANTYTGITHIVAGTLQIGNGTSGSINNTDHVVVNPGGILRFEPGTITEFTKVISGSGRVEYKGTNEKSLTFTANNTYTGTTNNEAGRIVIQGSTGGGNIINNEWLIFKHTGNAYTYSGVISGAGAVAKYGAATLTLNGTNTYTGDTHIYEGSLTLGASGSIENSRSVVLSDNAARLDISAGNKKVNRLSSSYASSGVILGARTLTIDVTGQGDVAFGGIISGTGGITKTGTGIFVLSGANTYTGTTTIQAGILQIAGTVGNIAGNIVNNTSFYINRSNEYTYSGIISGTGLFAKFGAAKTTLAGANTYTGTTDIHDGALALGANGSIESSSSVTFFDNNSKFDISAGSKSIKGLNSTYANSQVVLGARTLTIGTQGQNDGTGTFAGKFTGTGNVYKTGTGIFTMSGIHTATGTFSIGGGTLNMSNSWAGAFSQATNATWGITGTVSIGRTLTLAGGHIVMNLTGATPSRINVTGALVASGNTTLNITSGAVTNQVLIQAASGIGNTSNFTANLPGYTPTLSATGTYLMLTTAVVTKTVSVGTQNGILTAGTAGTVTFPVTTANIANGNYAATVTNLPTGVMVQGQVTVNNNSGTLTLAGNTATVAGTINTLRLTIDGTQSATFTLTVSAAAAKAVSAGTQNGILTAGTAGTVTFPVTTANIANGNYAATVANLPAGVTVQGQVTVNNNSGTLTLAGNTSTVAGATNTLRLTIDGTQSAAFTLTVNAAAVKTVSVGTQNGILTAGKAGTVTFPVTTANIANGNYAATVANLPTGVTVQGQVTINNNTGTLTLAGNTSTIAGTTNTLRLTIDGTQSAAFTLTISAAAAKTISVGTQNDILTAGTAGIITFPVTTANIANGSYPATIANLPAGVTVQGQVTINNNAGTLTLAGNTSTIAGIINTLTLTIDGTPSAAFMLTIEAGINSVEDHLKIDARLFPNPFTSELHLRGAEGCTLMVFSATGVAVHVQKITNSDESLRLEHLPAGVYFFRLEMKGKTTTVKVMKH